MSTENDDAPIVANNADDHLTADERAESRRYTALNAALRMRQPGHGTSREVVDDAKTFDAFLRGETNQ